MILIPYQVDVSMRRWPIANFALIGVTCVISLAVWYGGVPNSIVAAMVLHGWAPSGLIGHMFLHAGWIHLLGNMLFLWVFGNAVCAKVGNMVYLGLYLALGFAAAAVFNLIDGGLMIGASGGINGVIGMFLVWYALNTMSCLFGFFLIFWRQFSVSSYFMILLWLVFDLWGTLTGGQGVAYVAHVGGFCAGAMLAFALTWFGVVKMERAEKSLLEVLGIPLRNSGKPRAAVEAPDLPAPAPAPPRVVADSTVSSVAAVTPARSEHAAATIRFRCRKCGTRIRVAAHHAGKTGRCRTCGASVQVPAASK